MPNVRHDCHIYICLDYLKCAKHRCRDRVVKDDVKMEKGEVKENVKDIVDSSERDQYKHEKSILLLLAIYKVRVNPGTSIFLLISAR